MPSIGCVWGAGGSEPLRTQHVGPYIVCCLGYVTPWWGLWWDTIGLWTVSSLDLGGLSTDGTDMVHPHNQINQPSKCSPKPRRGLTGLAHGWQQGTTISEPARDQYGCERGLPSSVLKRSMHRDIGHNPGPNLVLSRVRP